jgi:hypothetical protein
MMRSPTYWLLGSGFIAAATFAACRYDPVPQDIIDGLGEESGEPSELHRAGQPCLACHSVYEGADPRMSVGGTIYYEASDGRILPAPDVLVEITDSRQVQRKACTNAAGNFWVEHEDWRDITFPLTVRAGERRMISLVGRDGSCASCHSLPDEASLDTVTGAGRASAGVVVVSESDVGAICAPSSSTTSSSSSTSSTSTTTSSGGGAGGDGGAGGGGGAGGATTSSTSSAGGGSGGGGGA